MGKCKDLTNQRFGDLIVLQRDENYVKEHNIKQNRSYWICKCNCGEITTVRGCDLTKTKNPTTCCKKCSKQNRLDDLTGQTFNYLTVLEPTDLRDSNRSVIFKCQCVCGKIINVSRKLLTTGDKTSCGCMIGRKQIKDLTGLRFNHLTALEIDDITKRGNKQWRCRCDCGNIVSVTSNHLITGHTKSCGCINLQYDLTNQHFGKVTVLKYIPHPINKKGNSSNWLCKCDCGNEFITTGDSLRNGTTKSCGCLRSAGEFKILQILKENNIKYEYQKSFDSCRFPDTNRLAHFDFYINDEFLLEFDGPQHYSYQEKGWNNYEYYLNITKKDKFKNQWCLENNIPLKRIPYNKLQTLNLNDILSNDFLIKENEKNE